MTQEHQTLIHSHIEFCAFIYLDCLRQIRQAGESEDVAMTFAMFMLDHLVQEEGGEENLGHAMMMMTPGGEA